MPIGHNAVMRLDFLPIFPLLPNIAGALETGSLVLSTETGAGKTSVVPAYLVESGSLKGKAIILEPRRLAATAAAARVSELLGTELGTTIGYRVRGDTRVSRNTRVEFVTEAVFIRMIQDDPLLSGISLVGFDEFHERSAACDLGLAFAVEAREARGDLSLLAMSATMDCTSISAYLACPVIEAPGRLYPIATSYRPPRAGEQLAETVTAAICEALDRSKDDVLAFLPGIRELSETSRLLGAELSRIGRVKNESLDIAILHGSLSLREQQAIMARSKNGRRRVVLATSVAETSLTISGIGAVVDSGLSRFMRLHTQSGLNKLVTERVSEAEARQRSGRAGRLGPGICIRCWDSMDILAPSRGTELQRIDLSSVVLECAIRGVRSPEAIRWLDPPPRYAWNNAATLLESMGLISAVGLGTELGKRAAALGTELRAAAAVLDTGTEPEKMHTVSLAAATMSEPDAPDTDGDFGSSLDQVLASAYGGDFGDRRYERIIVEANRLLRKASDLSGTRGKNVAFDPALAASYIPMVGDLMATRFADRLARRLADGTWEFSSGRRAQATFAPPRAEWLIAFDVDAGNPMGRIRKATPVTPAAAKSALSSRSTPAIEIEWKGLTASAWIRLKNGVFILGEKRSESVPHELLVEAFAKKLRAEGLACLPWSDDSRSLVDRARFAATRKFPALSPDEWRDTNLVERIAERAGDWLAPRGTVLEENGFRALIASLLDANTLRLLDEAVPAFVYTPGGRRRRPTYPAEGPARLAGRIQEYFGMAIGPSACGEPMTLEFLSPADRPLQVTSDLAGFWRSTYPSIRPEMARRYPKHYWPLDPLIAEPTKGQKPRTTA